MQSRRSGSVPSCRSWWAGRALPRRCIPSRYPHPFFQKTFTSKKNKLKLPAEVFFLNPPKVKSMEPFFYLIEGGGVTTPRGQSPPLKNRRRRRNNPQWKKHPGVKSRSRAAERLNVRLRSADATDRPAGQTSEKTPHRARNHTRHTAREKRPTARWC